MSRSLARVAAALKAAGVDSVPVEARGEIRTAEAAAAEAGVTVDPAKAAALAGEALSRAEVKVLRAVSGFAIGGVAPLGHLTPSPTYLDPRLLDFAEVWAAAGTPRHMFKIASQDLLRITQATRANFTG